MRRAHMAAMLLLTLSIFLSAHGCGTNKESVSGKLIAKINNYELTVDDFKSKASRGFSLEDVIIKNILIQEAQAQNFDKDRAFMKEIESYWEQALLKLLIKKKTEEFASKVTGANDEIKKAKVQKMLELWMADLRKRANVKIYGDNFREIQAR